jgi:hypothetical protein
MQPWTAAGFGLLGLSLWIARLRPVVAGALVVLGSFVMIEYALQIDLFGFDRWLLSPWPTAGVVHVGRMSPGTACSFILAGAAWVLSDRRPQIAVLGLFGCLPTLVVYIVRGRPSPVVPDATIMAVHTAIAFTLWWSYVLFVTRTR